MHGSSHDKRLIYFQWFFDNKSSSILDYRQCLYLCINVLVLFPDVLCPPGLIESDSLKSFRSLSSNVNPT